MIWLALALSAALLALGLWMSRNAKTGPQAAGQDTQVGGRYTSPSVLGPHVSPERMQEWLMSRVTKPWEPADDKPEEPGWTIQPEVESREGKGDVSTHDER